MLKPLRKLGFFSFAHKRKPFSFCPKLCLMVPARTRFIKRYHIYSQPPGRARLLLQSLLLLTFLLCLIESKEPQTPKRRRSINAMPSILILVGGGPTSLVLGLVDVHLGAQVDTVPTSFSTQAGETLGELLHPKVSIHASGRRALSIQDLRAGASRLAFCQKTSRSTHLSRPSNDRSQTWDSTYSYARSLPSVHLHTGVPGAWPHVTH